MLPLTIRFRYTFSDAIKHIWEDMSISPLRLTISFLINLLSLLLMLYFINNSDFTFLTLVPLIGAVINGLFLGRIIVIIGVIPSIYFFRIKKYGEIMIEYTELGITTLVLKESTYSTWDHYEGIELYEYSYRINKKDSVKASKIPIHAFGDLSKFREFTEWVKLKVE